MKGGVGLVGKLSYVEHTSMFSAAFCRGAVEASVLVDQGAYANLISPSVLAASKKADPTLLVIDLSKALEFSNAHSDVKVPLRFLMFDFGLMPLWHVSQVQRQKFRRTVASFIIQLLKMRW